MKVNDLSFLLLLFPAICLGNESKILPEYKKYFIKYFNERSIFSEKIAPRFGGAKVGRSFAIIAGVWDYEFGNLPPAKADMEELKSYLLNEEYFDEVVFLKNSEVNYNNLKYFLQYYFKNRLNDYPQSRFLFAYSGHGFSDGDEGYLVKSSATHLRDFNNSIGMDVLRPLIQKVVNKSHHTLVLINACHSGTFFGSSFGSKQYLPRKTGAHAITAGGSDEETFSIPSFGKGSLFFEVFLDGVRGGADFYPIGGDGIITFNEIFGYIHNNVAEQTTSQTPREGDLRPRGNKSEGSFFFIDKDVEILDVSIIDTLIDQITFGNNIPKPTVKNLALSVERLEDIESFDFNKEKSLREDVESRSHKSLDDEEYFMFIPDGGNFGGDRRFMTGREIEFIQRVETKTSFLAGSPCELNVIKVEDYSVPKGPKEARDKTTVYKNTYNYTVDLTKPLWISEDDEYRDGYRLFNVRNLSEDGSSAIMESSIVHNNEGIPRKKTFKVSEYGFQISYDFPVPEVPELSISKLNEICLGQDLKKLKITSPEK